MYVPDVASPIVQPPCCGCHDNLLHLIESEMDLGKNPTNFCNSIKYSQYVNILKHVSAAQIEKDGQIEQEATEKTTCPVKQALSIHLDDTDLLTITLNTQLDLV